MMTNPERNDPLHDVNLAQFEPPKLQPAAVRAVAAEMGFPSRHPKMPAHLPARCQQINVKLTHEVWVRWVDVAYQNRFAYGELLELALDALLEKWAAGR
jgi:hypothetical protein